MLRLPLGLLLRAEAPIHRNRKSELDQVPTQGRPCYLCLALDTGSRHLMLAAVCRVQKAGR